MVGLLFVHGPRVKMDLGDKKKKTIDMEGIIQVSLSLSFFFFFYHKLSIFNVPGTISLEYNHE